MKKVYLSSELSQRTPEWHNIRMGKFTSSNIHKLFASATKKERVEKALEEMGDYNTILEKVYLDVETKFACKTLGFDFKKFKGEIYQPESSKIFSFCESLENVHCFSDGAKTHILEKAGEIIFPEPEMKGINDAMIWGIDNEVFAKEAYIERTGFEFVDVGFVQLSKDEGSSPDNFIGENGMAEYKCPGQTNHLKNIMKIKNSDDLFKVHPKYWYQVQHQMYCSDKDWCDWVSFHPNLIGAYKNLGLHIIRVEKDEAMFKQFEKVVPLAVKLRDKYFKELTKNLG